jgi:hypothetical protein
MKPEIITLVIAGLGIAGTLGGIIVGHLLTRSWQRKQWLMDQRQSEFRELVLALEESLRAYLTKWLFTEAFTKEEHKEIFIRQSGFLKVVRTRIFTSKDMVRLNADERWGEAIHDYKKDGDTELFRNSYESLMRDLVKTATHK